MAKLDSRDRLGLADDVRPVTTYPSCGHPVEAFDGVGDCVGDHFGPATLITLQWSRGSRCQSQLTPSSPLEFGEEAEKQGAALCPHSIPCEPGGSVWRTTHRHTDTQPSGMEPCHKLVSEALKNGVDRMGDLALESIEVSARDYRGGCRV